MKIYTFTKNIWLLAILLIGLTSTAQAQWSGAYGNEWLAGKYGQEWVRIGVNSKGIQKVAISSLPISFQNADKTKMSLWHRGREVAVIKADNNEVLFYGVPNDGASDELLYRFPSSRKNPYYSTFSDESAYFLTINTSQNGLRANAPSATNRPDAIIESVHKKIEVKTFDNEYSHSTAIYYRPNFFNSYFEDGKQGTGTSLLGDISSQIYTSNPKPVLYGNSYVAVPFSFQIQQFATGGSRKITVHLKGRLGSAIAGIYVGKSSATGDLRSVGTITTTDFNDYDFTFDLQENDVDANGNGFIGFKSTRNGAEGSGYSVSYYIVEYDQKLDNIISTTTSNLFIFPARAAGVQSSISIANSSPGSVVYDITDVDSPQIISTTPSTFNVDRNGAQLKLLVTSTSTVNTKVSSVSFKQLEPSKFDYLILSSDLLVNSSTTYGNYRQSLSPGKKYKPLVVNMTEVYNQFNYGEPSPVAIRRFVDYMISDGNKEKFLLLIGKSVTYFERATREMPGEVPTVGFPGSDLLLVDGLGGTDDDVPAIPVGRISASSDDQVLDYLAKITKYESQSDLSWRKKVVHMNGGKSTYEVDQFANYLAGISGPVLNSPFSGNITIKKKTMASDVVENISLAPEVNSGVGFISYFGHGNVDKTDYNAGYATDNSFGYSNTNNYPVLFYNGCGVNNIFSGRHGLVGSSPGSLVRPMSLDWLLAKDRGAIVVFGNTWDAYAYNSNEYLDRLYPVIFSQSDSQRKTIGQILKEVAQIVKTEKGYTYNIAQNARVQGIKYDVDRSNVHQVLLQGDPALRILITDSALPVSLVSFEGKEDQNGVKLSWSTASEVNNDYFIVERSTNARNFVEIGRVEGKGNSAQMNYYTYYDLNPSAGTSYYRLVQVDNKKTTNGLTAEGERTESKIISIEREAKNEFFLSPNPTGQYVELKVDPTTSISEWELFDISGSKLKSGNGSAKIDLSEFPFGSYLVRVLTADGRSVTRTVIRR